MVLDASALLAVLLQEPRHEELLAKVEEAGVVAIGVPTVLETAMVLSGRISSDARARVLGLLRRMEAEIVPFTEEHFGAAMDAFLRYGKGRHPAALNFGDCMAYAVAAVSGLPLLYTGSDFAQTDIPAA